MSREVSDETSILDIVQEMQDIAEAHIEGSINASGDLDAGESPPCARVFGKPCYLRTTCGFESSDSPFVGMSNGGAQMSTLLDRLKEANAAIMNGTCPPDLPGEPVPPQATDAEAEQVGAVGIIPPDAPSRETPVEPAVAKDAVDVVTESTTPAKKGRSSKKAKSADLTSESASPTIETVSTSTEGPLKVSKTISGPHIYVDCFPVKNANLFTPVMADEWMAPIFRAVEVAAGVKDWRLIKYEAKGLISEAIRMNIGTLPPVVLLSSLSAFSEAFLEVVTPHAASITKALKG